MGTNLKSNQDFHNSIDFTSNISSTSSLSPNNNMSKSRPEEYELIEKNIITSQGVEELFDKVLKLVQPQQRKLSMSMSMSLSPSLSASIARNKPFLQKSSLSSPSSLLSAPTEIDFQCYGLFAQSNISLGNFIAEYKGEVCLKSDYKDNPTNGYKDLGTTKPYVLFYPTLDLCVDARRYGTYARFVRRSCNPNAETRTMYINDGIVKDRQLHLGIFAKCDIMQNQEITVGWNWDNQHVAHIFIRKDGGGDVGGKGRDNDDLDQVIDLNKRIQMGTVVYNLLKFTECACEDKNNCVIEKMKNYAKKPKDDLTKNKEGYYFDPQQSNNPYNKRKIQVSSYADNSGPKHINFTLSRATFESLTDDLIQKTITPCKQAMKDANVDKKDIREIILVGAQDKATSKDQSITIAASSGLSKQEIEKMIHEAESHADADRLRKEIVEATNHADSVIYETEKAMTEYHDRLNQSEVDSVKSLIQELRDMVASSQHSVQDESDLSSSSGKAEDIRLKAADLQKASLKLFEAMYKVHIIVCLFVRGQSGESGGESEGEYRDVKDDKDK
ncbi:21773_t:CDS:2, partial [Entrophospora sp. SA101]